MFNQSSGGDFKARVEPEVPFAIPEVLRLPTIVAGQGPGSPGERLRRPPHRGLRRLPAGKGLAPSWARAIYTWPGVGITTSKYGISISRLLKALPGPSPRAQPHTSKGNCPADLHLRAANDEYPHKSQLCD